MDDTKVLTDLNLQFIDAWRKGSWDLLRPILSPEFVYLDGSTGEVVDLEKYEASLRNGAVPSIGIDQVVIHIDGNTAVVSSRTFRDTGKHRRYVDTYEKRDGNWICVHACVWPID